MASLSLWHHSRSFALNRTIFDGGDKVFVLIAFEAMAEGGSYSFPNNGHLWQFNGAGKVVKFDHVTDTAQMARMAKGQ